MFDRPKPVHPFSPDEDLDYDDHYKDELPDEKVEGFATSEVVFSYTDNVEERDSSPTKWADDKKSEFHVEFVGPLPKSWVGCSGSASEEMNVVCTEDGFQITLPPGKLSNIQVVDCAVHVEERISCSRFGTSPSDCEKKGCCMDLFKHSCYYPLDECTVDQHAVFAIRHDCAAIPVDPRKIISGGPHCKPAIVNDKVAVFKIKLDDCGVRSYEVGDMKIYMIEVHIVVSALNLKYGIITRNDPLRFLIECRYMKHGGVVAEQSIASIGYMVKASTSNLPSSIISSGRHSVQLKIAKDRSYSSYYPTYHQPLQLLLGHPVYLELSLRSSKPEAVLLVNYCLAYPRSAKNALVLIHEGCANPNDPTVSILEVNDLPQNRHQRRFSVKAFHFMDQRTNLYLNEEIYFMCSTEVCMPIEKPCEERCFDGKG
ncbi:hypothetical protein XENORESO_009678 [Xenotaenia resolanae]|uniref:Uncharacterized protein n=1 Tax=Xenotaenia resolanae TaxID=208358 RepID=A0ABV0WS67_9TELE